MPARPARTAESPPKTPAASAAPAGTRISVELIMEWLGTGGSPEAIALKHPLLTKDLVLEAIRYAARFSRNEIVIEVRPGH